MFDLESSGVRAMCSYNLEKGQIDFFKSEGYLILEDFLPVEYIESWRHALRERLGVETEDPAEWRRDAPGTLKGNAPKAQGMPLNRLGQMQKVIETVGGSRFEGGEEQLIHRWPDPSDEPWKPPVNGHIDLIFQAFHWRFSLGATTYLYEVESQGGAFCIWPGSHHLVWEFFQRFPQLYMTGASNSKRHAMEAKMNEYANRCAPIEFVARPGTLLLWHAFLLHEASRNVRRTPRAGVFFRWGEPVPQGESLETFGDLWEHWAI